MTFYQVHNTSRRSETRGQRSQNPTHRGYKQFVGGHHRVVTGRALMLSEEQVIQHLPELKAKAAIGLISVTTMDGRVVSLDDACFLAAAPLPPTVPLPQRKLDSIANDEPWGRPVEVLPGTDSVITDEKDFELPASIGVDFSAEPVAEEVTGLPAPSAVHDDNRRSKKKRY